MKETLAIEEQCRYFGRASVQVRKMAEIGTGLMLYRLR